MLVHSSAVVPLSRVEPRFPAAARVLGSGPQRCVVRFVIDREGIPETVTVEGCPALYHAAVEEAASQWRFSPARGADGRPMRASFRLGVTFRLR
jgi:protein TonB